MKIGFFGTPAHSAYLLQELLAANFEISFVVTNVDKPVGRKKTLQAPPVKQIALQANIPVLQFPSIKSAEAIAAILAIPCDIHVIFAYGAIIPSKIFSNPPLGAINLHGSLLPEYRGASPVQSAILAGREITGYTLQYIAKKMDAGDIIAQEEITINPTDDFASLLEKITRAGSQKLIELLQSKPQEKFASTVQEHDKATFCHKITSAERKLDLGKTNWQVHNQIRALNPYQVPFFYYKGKRINVHKSIPLEERFAQGSGSFYKVTKKTLAIVCSDNTLLSLLEVQPENKKKMPIQDFINGFKPETGDKIE
ncbi:MAG: methionyl-tRNA formyltransferase [Spirochaetota bacterium]